MTTAAAAARRSAGFVWISEGWWRVDVHGCDRPTASCVEFALQFFYPLSFFSFLKDFQNIVQEARKEQKGQNKGQHGSIIWSYRHDNFMKL